MAERCGLTMLIMFTARNYKVNGTQTCRMCYTLFVRYIHRNSMFGNERFKRYGVLNQVCFQTLFVVRHVNAIPNRILFQEMDGTTRL